MYLVDGYQILTTFSLNPNLSLWEKSVTPPGMDGGGPIEIATMRNEITRTRNPKALLTITEMKMVCAFNANTYDEFFAVMQIIQSTLVTFPDGFSMTIFGWLDKFMPQEFSEGNMPLSDVTFYPSGMNASYAEETWVIEGP